MVRYLTRKPKRQKRGTADPFVSSRQRPASSSFSHLFKKIKKRKTKESIIAAVVLSLAAEQQEDPLAGSNDGPKIDSV